MQSNHTLFARGLASVLLLTLPLGAQELPEYELQVRLEPETHVLEVQGEVYLPPALRTAGSEFVLNRALKIHASSPSVRVVEKQDGDGDLVRYALEADASAGWLRLHYAGSFDYGLSDQKEEYTRGFRDTQGIVGPQGVYLDGSSRWIPKFDDGLLRFRIEVVSPAGWHVISQGNGTSGDGDGRATWSSGGALEQIYLVGGALRKSTESAGTIETLVYLHDEDEALVHKYLDATARYLEMYRGLIGPYPYEKFALVENFWETGYGMPSFTLLGEQVIRFPFILHSSYPHEILHNWWGNSVFVDYESGNWCEGLTAYMADHLIQEQRGQGALYRRSTLQKYRDYVKEGRDFPLREFRSRHDAASEAVGYGKSLMGFHRLRNVFGDEIFIRALADFYRENRGRRASFDDLRVAFEKASDNSAGAGREHLEAIFREWLEREGAPQFALKDISIDQADERYVINGQIVQLHEGDPFHCEVPVVVTTAEGSRRLTITNGAQGENLAIECDSKPLALAVDPEFDVFRLLDPRETPPSIGQIFGEPRILALLPSASDESERARYREMVEGWLSDAHDIRILLDNELEAIPAESAVWILGAENRFAFLFEAWRERAARSDSSGNPLLSDQAPVIEGHCQVVIERHPQDIERAIGWIVLDPPAASPGLVRKLPHYGKYSYLAFSGDEPTNVLKGQWDTDDSPLVWRAEDSAPVAMAFEERRALAEYPAAFSQRALREHVEWLAAPEREGRGLGSEGLQASAEYIAEAFAEMGLEPAGDGGGWFQEFTVPEGSDGKPVKTANVIGLLRGTHAGWESESVILSAHYDHLGRGWPDVHAGDEGVVHEGANDNASGVAVMLELAKNLIEQGGGSRNLLVIAFSAEESGLQGSRHYVTHPVLPLDKTIGVINLDAVGMLNDGPVTIFGCGTAYEWPHVFMGCGFVTGIANKVVPAGAEGSDQWSFIQAGVPGVQVFAGAGEHYHRPGDTAELLDYAGLVQVATFLKEGIVHMLERDTAFKVTIEGFADQEPAPTTAKRGVSFGSIPEYGYDKGGMLLSGVSENSPAERAGLRKGDVLIRIDETEIENTRGFANVLKTLEAGQTIVATVIRDGEELKLEVTVVAR